jgi:adenylosuccinate lyase
MATWQALGTPAARSFRDFLLDDPEVAGRVPAAAIDAALDFGIHARHVDAVFARVFGAG